MASQPFDASRFVLVTYSTFLTGFRPDGAGTEPHHYLGVMHDDDDAITILRAIAPEELAPVRERIDKHNVAIRGGAEGDPELSPLQIDTERKRAALRRGGPSPLFRGSNE